MTELNPSPSLLSAATRGLDRHRDDELLYGLTLETWLKIGILTPLFIAVYWLVLRWLWDKTNPIYGEANWGHAICIPVVGLYYLYINREDLLKQPVQPSWSGLGIAVFGLAAFAYGIWPGQNQFFQGCAMILTLFGIVLLLCGWHVMKFAWFPIAYLICGVPWPSLVYSYIASPLQTLAAKVAVVTLRFTGVNAYRTGTKINMGGITEPLRSLNVAEACAGLRSLMTFITVGIAVAFLSARPLWQKIIITLSAIPIAIFCNVMRVAGQGLLDHYVSRQLSESFAHQFVGLVMLVPAFFMILLVGWILDHLFVEEVDEKQAAMAGGVITRPAYARANVAVAPVAVRATPAVTAAVPRAPKTRAAVVKSPAPVAPAAKTQATRVEPGTAAPVAKPQAGVAPKDPIAPQQQQTPAAPAVAPAAPWIPTPPPPATTLPRPNIYRAPAPQRIPPRPPAANPPKANPLQQQPNPPTPPKEDA
ncbi:MAG: exosortase [Vicinamibacterales bacterium]